MRYFKVCFTIKDSIPERTYVASLHGRDLDSCVAAHRYRNRPFKLHKGHTVEVDQNGIKLYENA